MISLLLSFAFSLCGQWQGPTQIGVLNSNHVSEASGLVIDQNHFYHINDSGDKNHLYQTDQDGKNTKIIKLKNTNFFDHEAMAITRCKEQECLVVGDIGDNHRIRGHIVFYFYQFNHDKAKELDLLHTLKVKYPDQARNAEAFSFDQDGNLIIVTKEGFDKKKQSKDALIYTLNKNKLMSNTTQVLNKKQVLPIRQWIPNGSWLSHLVTDMVISKKYWIILTYHHILILNPDKTKQPIDWLCKKIDFNKKDLPQAEAISFFKNKIIVTSEKRKKNQKQKIFTWFYKGALNNK